MHHGLEISQGLRDKLGESIQAVKEIEGSSTEEKLKTLGAVGGFIQIPAEFVSSMLDNTEQLATEMLVPDLSHFL